MIKAMKVRFMKGCQLKSSVSIPLANSAHPMRSLSVQGRPGLMPPCSPGPSPCSPCSPSCCKGSCSCTTSTHYHRRPRPHPRIVSEYHFLDAVPRVEAALMRKCRVPPRPLSLEVREAQNGLLHHQPSDYCFSRSKTGQGSHLSPPVSAYRLCS
jgi:hypothetical protein